MLRLDYYVLVPELTLRKILTCQERCQFFQVLVHARHIFLYPFYEMMPCSVQFTGKKKMFRLYSPPGRAQFCIDSLYIIQRNRRFYNSTRKRRRTGLVVPSHRIPAFCSLLSGLPPSMIKYSSVYKHIEAQSHPTDPGRRHPGDHSVLLPGSHRSADGPHPQRPDGDAQPI